jgi:hypothetical protein
MEFLNGFLEFPEKIVHEALLSRFLAKQNQVKLGLVAGNDQMLAKVKLLLKNKGCEMGAQQTK